MILRFGEKHPTHGYRSEALERQTFADERFDLVMTQDVMEHIFDVEAAFRKIYRTVAHLFPPEYHGNPMSKEGS